jgi:hypothetical protein
VPYSTYQKNAWLNTWRNVSFAVTQTYASLHSANPGDSGANELSGGSPAYARKAVNWNAASAGSLDDSTAPVFDVPAGSTVAFVGIWDAPTGGNFLGYSDVTDESFAAQGTYTATDIDANLNA